MVGYYDWQSDLYQWMCGSKLCLGAMESMLSLEVEDEIEAIEVKVRGPPGSGRNCFLFLEDLLGIVDMVSDKNRHIDDLLTYWNQKNKSSYIYLLYYYFIL